MATPIDPQSVAFLLAESRNQPMHVGGLNLFEKPDDAGPSYVREMYEESLDVDEIRTRNLELAAFPTLILIRCRSFPMCVWMASGCWHGFRL